MNGWKYETGSTLVVWCQDGTLRRSVSVNDPEIVTWIADGNTPDPADPPPVQFTAEQPVAARVRTTDATPTELYRLPLAALTGYAFVTALIGVDAGNGAARVLRSSSAWKRLNASALQIGSTVVIANHTDAGASTWTLSAATSGNDVVVTVTGAAGRTVDWSLSGTVVRFSPSGF